MNTEQRAGAMRPAEGETMTPSEEAAAMAASAAAEFRSKPDIDVRVAIAELFVSRLNGLSEQPRDNMRLSIEDQPMKVIIGADTDTTATITLVL